MRTRTVLLFVASVAAAAAEGADSSWATVPANPSTPVATALVAAAPPDESWVQLVGTGPRPAAGAVAAGPAAVVALTIPRWGAPNDTAEPSVAVPSGARWPDAAGRILEPVAGTTSEGSPAPRNPWLPRPAASNAHHTEAFLFGGYIAGGPGGPVGLVNGRAVRSGDRVGNFTVAQVLANAVVLERSGTAYAIPRGAHIVIELRST